MSPRPRERRRRSAVDRRAGRGGQAQIVETDDRLDERGHRAGDLRGTGVGVGDPPPGNPVALEAGRERRRQLGRRRPYRDAQIVDARRPGVQPGGGQGPPDRIDGSRRRSVAGHELRLTEVAPVLGRPRGRNGRRIGGEGTRIAGLEHDIDTEWSCGGEGGDCGGSGGNLRGGADPHPGRSARRAGGVGPHRCERQRGDRSGRGQDHEHPRPMTPCGFRRHGGLRCDCS